MSALVFPPGTTNEAFHKWRWDGEKWVAMHGWLPLTGGTLTGTLKFVGPRDIVGTNAGLDRWRLSLGDADTFEVMPPDRMMGSPLTLRRYDDAGARLDTSPHAAHITSPAHTAMTISRGALWGGWSWLNSNVYFLQGADITWPGANIKTYEVPGCLQIRDPIGRGLYIYHDEVLIRNCVYHQNGTGGGMLTFAGGSNYAQFYLRNGANPTSQLGAWVSVGRGARNAWPRVRMYLSVNPETGGDTGSDFIIRHYSDAENGWVRDSLTITRSTGVMTITQPLSIVSDAALKEDVQPIEQAGDLIKRLRGVHYRHKQTRERAYGFVAQEAQEVMPEIVRKTGDHLGVSGQQLVPVLIETIKQLKNRIAALRAEAA